MTFNPDCDLVWGFQFEQQGKISWEEFAYKSSGTLCPYASKVPTLR